MSKVAANRTKLTKGIPWTSKVNVDPVRAWILVCRVPVMDVTIGIRCRAESETICVGPSSTQDEPAHEVQYRPSQDHG